VRLDAMLDPLLHPGCGSWSPTGDWFACLGFTDEESPRRTASTVRSSDGGGLLRLMHALPPGDIPGD
jgi:hypothetical protein